MTVETTEYRLVLDPNVRGMFSNQRGDAIATSVTVLDNDVRVEVYERDAEAFQGDVSFTRTADLRMDATTARVLAARLTVLADAADRNECIVDRNRDGATLWDCTCRECRSIQRDWYRTNGDES